MGRNGPSIQVPHIRLESIIQYKLIQIKKNFYLIDFLRSDRLGHVTNSYTSEQSPLFLLFLDCTWQLVQQFPADFEFSETFLTTLWDSAFVPIFDTFLFNCEHDRKIAIESVRSQYISAKPWT